MTKLKVAILEDDKTLLKEAKLSLEESGLVEVIFCSFDSNDFFTKLENNKVQALVLDIDLAGHTLTGIEVAAKCKLPVIFRSGQTDKFNSKIEDVSHFYDFPVERLKKVCSEEATRNVLKKFIKQVESFEKSKKVTLNLVGKKSTSLNTDNIVYLTTTDAGPSNLMLYFNDREPEIATDLPFNKLIEKGFPMDLFKEIHRSYYVNIDKIKEYIKPTNFIVEVINKKGQLIDMELKIAEDKQPKFRKLFSK
jgi:DNA-binding LytR/AlgR family response regulator